MKRIHKGIALLLILAMTVTMTACSKHTPAVTSSLSSSELDSSLDSSSTLGDLESSVSSQSSSSIASSSSTAVSSATSSSSAKAKISSAVTSTKSNHTTAAANTAPKGSGSASHNTGGTGAKTNVPPQKAQPAPTQKPSEPPKPAQPKTAYDKPYDITQIRNDMIAYGKSRGMQYTESLHITNAAYDFPLSTADCSNEDLKKNSQDDVEYVIEAAAQLEPGTKPSNIRFNVEIQPDPLNSGEYLLYVPYG